MNNNIKNIANQAIQAMRQGQIPQALQLFSQLQTLNVQHFELIKAHGIALLQHGDETAAKSRLLDALALNDNADAVHNIVGDLYKKEGQLQLAKQHFEKAIALNDKVFQYHFNMGLCLKQDTNWRAAIDALQRVLALKSDFDKARMALADCYLQLNDVQQSLSILSKVLNKNDIYYLNRYCDVLLRNSQLDSALDTFNQAVKLQPNAEFIYETYALGLLHHGLNQQALAVFKQGLSVIPNSAKLLGLYASLAFESGAEQPFLPYVNIPKSQLTASLAAEHLNKLVNSGHLNAAEQQLQHYKKTTSFASQLLYSECQIHKNQGRFADVLKCVNDARVDLNNPQSLAIKELYSDSLLATDKPADALKHIEQLLSWQPNNQYYWALKSSCLRLTDSSAYQQLCDYDKLVFRRELEIDKTKYANLDSFNQELMAVLEDIHQMKHQPLAQSVYQGIQTPGFLFQHDQPIIADLRRYLKNTAKSVLNTTLIDSLAASHPVRQFYRQDFDFATAWSIWIEQGGFHRSHVHPKGWYSSAYYVAVPESVNDANDHQGCFAVGKPGLQLNSDMQQKLDFERYLQPEVGILTLFPSYVWHSTIPFTGSEPRVSVAFDLK
ncbi:tetratricopeptide repeat protein [Thalassotalea sp. HSM 43]|uniref:2OG-Fe(II) oxygenase family protein n=1 Tax=Thalassotalea sp. HSM 43 TaxID=2552945 RepID=UPI0010804FE6|nr:putative 2OG-Fe(II) oxygenase [Thalassotalea sp. HSM 43]QBY06007.1 tetratricopeptide repeat protein [Thalassotalea sp. HSM 43]